MRKAYVTRSVMVSTDSDTLVTVTSHAAAENGVTLSAQTFDGSQTDGVDIMLQPCHIPKVEELLHALKAKAAILKAEAEVANG